MIRATSKDGHLLNRQIGTRLKAMRADRLTQDEVAAMCGVTGSAVSGWESGKGCSVEHLATIGRECAVSLDWLILGRGKMYI